MNRLFPIAIFIAGIVFLISGINANGSFASGASEAITGTPSDKSIWYILLGIVGIIVGGLGSLFRRSIG